MPTACKVFELQGALKHMVKKIQPVQVIEKLKWLYVKIA